MSPLWRAKTINFRVGFKGLSNLVILVKYLSLNKMFCKFEILRTTKSVVRCVCRRGDDLHADTQ